MMKKPTRIAAAFACAIATSAPAQGPVERLHALAEQMLEVELDITPAIETSSGARSSVVLARTRAR